MEWSTTGKQLDIHTLTLNCPHSAARANNLNITACLNEVELLGNVLQQQQL
jgi:hypothetical protein